MIDGCLSSRLRKNNISINHWILGVSYFQIAMRNRNLWKVWNWALGGPAHFPWHGAYQWFDSQNLLVICQNISPLKTPSNGWRNVPSFWVKFWNPQFLLDPIVSWILKRKKTGKLPPNPQKSTILAGNIPHFGNDAPRVTMVDLNVCSSSSGWNRCR